MSAVERIVVFDLGTTNFKACIFDEDAALLAMKSIPTPVTSPANDFREISVAAFQDAVGVLLEGLAEERTEGLSDITAITFATQTNSFLLLDDQDAPLTPIILWNDHRASGGEALVAPANELIGFYATTGIPALTTEFMIAKLLWLRQQHPEIVSRAARLCLISDYLTYWMTGSHVTEAGAAGLTGLMDIHRLCWWQEVLEAVDLPETLLPEIHRAGTRIGPIRSAVADALHLPADCQFIIGCLDQYAGAIGSGNVFSGLASETTGTVLASVRCCDNPLFEEGLGIYTGPSYRDRHYYQMVFGDVSANLLEAYRNSLPHSPAFNELTAAAAESAVTMVMPETDSLPALLDWIDIYRATLSEGEMTRVILERVAVALKQQMQVLFQPQMPDRVRCVGGAARSTFWLQLKANCLDCPVIPINCPEPTSLGAALLALSAQKEVPLETLADTLIPYGTPIEPEPI